MQLPQPLAFVICIPLDFCVITYVTSDQLTEFDDLQGKNGFKKRKKTVKHAADLGQFSAERQFQLASRGLDQNGRTIPAPFLELFSVALS
jgi:hypothetical protein